MIRNLKALGLALVAILAMSAMTASLASAQVQGELTFDGPTKLTGTDTVGQPSLLQYNGTQTLRCHGHYHAGEENQTEEVPPKSGKFTHKKVPGNAKLTTLTVTPTYSNCIGKIGELEAPATVTMNGCDYVLHIGVTTENTHYGVTADAVCPPGKEIEVHIYSNATHETSICTYKFGPQTAKPGSFVQNEAGGKVTLGGTTTGIHATRSGILCGGNNTVNNASLTVHALLEGKNEAGGATHLTLTEV